MGVIIVLVLTGIGIYMFIKSDEISAWYKHRQAERKHWKQPPDSPEDDPVFMERLNRRRGGML